MKKILYLSLIFILSLCTASCVKDECIPKPSGDKQTLFIYMPWSTNLTSYFYNNIEDFEKAIEKNKLGNTRILVFLSTSPEEATLFELTYEHGKNSRVTYENYTNPAFTTAEGITAILNDVKHYAPASRYAMIVGCHGMGWLPVSSPSSRSLLRQKDYWEYTGVPLTRYFGGLTSDCQTDITTLANGIGNAGMKMECILFDDCYMSSIEVAYDLRNVTNYLIASPTEIMIYGFPYHTVGEHLIGEINYRAICDEFYNFYSNYPVMPCGTIAVVDCSEMENLASVMKEINLNFTFNPVLTDQVQKMCGYSPTLFFDYGDYVHKLCPDQALLARFNTQLNKTVPYKMNTDSYYSMAKGKVEINTYSGVTISDPSVNTKSEAKTGTAWYKKTH